MTHLTPDAWHRLRGGTCLPEERAALLRHLGEPCDVCDEQAEALDDGPIDATIDAALASLVVVPPVTSLMFRRLEDRIVAGAFPRPRRWLAVLPVALAAGVALFVVQPFTPTQREKGGDPLPPSLTAVVAVKKGAALAPIAPTQTYPASAELFFTYVLPTDAHVYLGRVGVDGVVEAFYPAVGQSDAIERAGTHPLTVGGTVHAYSLEGLRGKQRFVLLSSPEPLDPSALAKALKEGAGRSASVEVEVDGW